MANKVGSMIKEARTAKGWTQEQLAKKISGVSAADISKYERGETVPTQAVLKEIARQTGVTQSSLINAAKESTESKAAAAKSSTAKRTSQTASTKSSTTKTAAAKSNTPANATISMKVSSTEQKLIEMYRAADSNTRKAATKVLKGECSGMLDSLLGNGGGGVSDVVADLITGALGNILGGK